MGVPKFYRWISERYPCLSEVVKEYQIPEFDNLYLDMNGIIHLCSHPNDDDPHFRITEEQIYSSIFHYIECLFRLIKPRKVFFMAVDGVAPRAKMNQQRGRRFRSAREALDLEKRAIGRGEVLPTEKRFDSNCITPGTEFMANLHEQLKYFVNHKISTDKMWQGLRIYLSGHETPGEGEHKIMDFIRYEKSQPSYDPNTRHCLYGLDADLIMLGLCTHEPHFSLLREEVRFTKKKSKRIPTPEETTFHLLHLSLLREYLEHEFSPIKNQLQFPFDVEKIVDDWVMMGFLVGNDFIPNLPHFHIAHGALPTLYRTYCNVLPTLDGYINEGGCLNLPRFEKYVQQLAQVEYEHFSENTYADLKWLESKATKANTGSPEKAASKSRIKEEESSNKNQFGVLEGLEMDDFQDDKETDTPSKGLSTEVPVGLLVNLGDYEEDEQEFEEDEDEEDDDDLIELEFGEHKRHYYMDKMDYQQVTHEILRDQAECFVRAVQWNLNYYYNGLCSWSWYYPHHYAPYISDIKNFSHLKLDFELGTPFLPFEQLLAVLPAASKSLLPEPYQELMCNEDSPLIEYYPEDFRTDLNGKQQDWEAVVLIPFIDEEKLLGAMRSKNELLTSEERIRNRHGPCLLYTYSEKALGTYASPMPDKFPNVIVNHARCTEIPLDEFSVSRHRLVKGLCEGTRLDVFFPGFPTFKHIPHKSMLKKAEVRVFQGNSHGDNMILTIEKRMSLGLLKAAEEFLNKTVYVGWPHLIEAKVTSVSNEHCKCKRTEKTSDRLINDNKISEEEMAKDQINIWRMEKNNIIETYKKRWGVEIGETTILIHATPLIGRKYIYCNAGKVTVQKQWSSRSIPYALQTIVTDIQVYDSSFRQYLTLEEIFLPKTLCFMLGAPHYGNRGEVLSCNSKKKEFVEIQLEVLPDVDMEPIRYQHDNSYDDYMPDYAAAQRLGISAHLFSCITSTLYACVGSKSHPGNSRVNLGLCLKFNKRNEEVPGYTKKIEGRWFYSLKTIEVVDAYISKFPEIFDYLSKHLHDGNYFIDDMIAKCPPETTIQEIRNFLNSLPSQQIVRQHCGSDAVTEDVIKTIEQTVDGHFAKIQIKATRWMVRPQLLFLPGNLHGSSAPDPSAKFHLLDRVVNIREGYTVPLGLRGTIIAIQSADREADVMYEVVFDKEFCGGLALRCSPSRGYRMPGYALINMSHHERQLNHNRQKPMAVVHPRSAKASDSELYGSYSLMLSTGKKGRTDKPNIKSSSKSASTLDGRPTSKQQSVNHHVLEQTSYPNTLNHSPNSPFIAKQQRQPAHQTQMPQFVTPKMSKVSQVSSSSWHGLTSQQQPHRPQGQLQQGQNDDEFQNLWRELHSKSDQSQKPIGSKNSPDLIQAAKSLPKQHVYYNRNTWSNNPLNKTEVIHQGVPPMPAFGTKATGEFPQMLLALETQLKVKETKNTPSILNSTNASSDLSSLLDSLKVTHSGEQEKVTPNTKPETKQLTVHQLFKETNEWKQRTPSEQQTKGVSTAAYIELQDARPQAIGKPENGSYVKSLMNIIQTRCGSMPLYEYIKVGPSQMFSARVKLPDGRIFTGGVACTKEEASEWAAKCAFNELMLSSQQKQPLAGNTSGHAPPLNQSAMAHQMTGMAVRMNPVYPLQHQVVMSPGMPHYPLHPLTSPPYGAYPQGNMTPIFQIRQPFHYPHTYPAGGSPQLQPSQHSRWPGPTNTRMIPHDWMYARSGPHDQTNMPITNNSFIPLQVIKQNVTPKKVSSGNKTVMEGVDFVDVDTSRSKTHYPMTIPSADGNGLVSGGQYLPSSTSTEIPSTIVVHKEMIINQMATQNPKTSKQRPRSRLAIKFDTTQT